MLDKALSRLSKNIFWTHPHHYMNWLKHGAVEGGVAAQTHPQTLGPGQHLGELALTRVTVRSLFYNLPVRRAFLRTAPKVEFGPARASLLRKKFASTTFRSYSSQRGRS